MRQARPATKRAKTRRLVPLLLIILISGAVWPLAAGQEATLGQWRTLPYLMPINPVHVALMNNGKVLIASGSGNVPTNQNFEAAVWDPQAGTIVRQPLAWDMFCNGMITLPDGRVFVNGGTLAYDPFRGETRSAGYDPATGEFTDLEVMAHGRWYPTVTTLGDGSVMAFSGLSDTGGTNKTVEIYTPGSGWSQEYTASWTPPLYPRMHLLPDGNVLVSGSAPLSRLFNSSTKAWSNVASTNYSGTRTYGTSVLLPLSPANGYRARVMILGGGNPATATTEIIDMSAATPAWQYGPPMSQPRIEMNATILPSGKVLAVGGSTNDEDAATASLNADLYDPATNTFSPAGANVYPRLYHSNALLLADGTVLVVGGNPQRGSYEPHMEIYSPAYLFKVDGSPATRPSITAVPATINYGGTFQVQTPDAGNIASVVLVRPGAPTHAFDMDQRLVKLSYTAGSGELSVTAPPNGNVAPPGHYMLFIVNSAGVPSIASFLDLPYTADFSLSASPAMRTVLPGGTTSYVATATGGTGFNGTVSFSVTGLPPGTTATFQPVSVTGSGTSTMSVTTTGATPLGAHPLTITGTSGGLVHSVTVTLIVGLPGLP